MSNAERPRAVSRRGFVKGTALAAGDTQLEYGGRDRTVHASHHLMLSYVLGTSYRRGLSHHLDFPPVVGMIPDYGQAVGGDLALEAFSWVAGQSYEFEQTLNWNNLMAHFFYGKEVADGFYDPQYPYDICANRLGAVLGSYFLESDRAGTERMLQALNDPALRRRTDTPQIPQVIYLLRKAA